MDKLSFARPTLDRDEIAGIYQLAVETAEEAGQEAAERRASGFAVERTKSNHLDVVTQADIAVEQLIKRHVFDARPQDAFIGEESESVVGSSRVAWLVDPIDGTVNYMYGDSAYAVSIAAYEGGVPIAGVVYSPGRGELWSAAHGCGSFLNGAVFKTPDSPSPKNPLFATVFDYDADVRGDQTERLLGIHDYYRDLRLVGSTALEICRVSAGTIDCFYADTVNWWDVAAGLCIANEAGSTASARYDSGTGKVECLVHNSSFRSQSFEKVVSPELLAL